MNHKASLDWYNCYNQIPGNELSVSSYISEKGSNIRSELLPPFILFHMSGCLQENFKICYHS